MPSDWDFSPSSAFRKHSRRLSDVGGYHHGYADRCGGRYAARRAAERSTPYFRKDIYAIACICGGLIYYLCMYLDLPAAPTQFIAACSVILIRILAVRYGISLPALKGETRPAPKEK